RDPDAVIAVGLAPWDLLDMRGVHEQTGEVVLQRVEHGFPENAGALHRHVRHAVRRQPVPQYQQLADRRAERLHMLLRLATPSADAHARRNRLLVHVQCAATLKLSFHGPPPALASPPSVGAFVGRFCSACSTGNNAGCRTLPRHTESRTTPTK